MQHYYQFEVNEIVRNQFNRLLTVSAKGKEGEIFVQEEPDPYMVEELEKIDQTNVVKFTPRY